MISRRTDRDSLTADYAAARPVESAEQWLGWNRSEKRRLWERLNPRHRRQLQVLARALVLRQSPGKLSDKERARLAALADELDVLAARMEKLCAELLAGGKSLRPDAGPRGGDAGEPDVKRSLRTS